MRRTLRAGIVGGTGYAGAELVRLLAAHPNVEVSAITSRTDSGKPVDGLFPNLRGHTNLVFRAPCDEVLKQCDVVFFATPHGVAMESTPRLLEAGVRIVDLSGDFRLQDPGAWARWYGKDHACPEYLAKAIYGLPELNRSAIATASLVAVPGCYPTAIQIGFIPLLESNLVEPGSLTAAAMSGVSGAGRQASIENLLTECSDSMKAYSVAGHRHLPEIEQGLQRCAGSPVQLTFVPHLAPMVRGIHATLTARLTGPATDIQELFEARYREEPAVDVMPAGSHPQTRSVRGANLCRLAIHRPQGRDVVVVLSVIDNLVKGAAGQALQCMNLMLDLPEMSGLNQVPLSP